MGLSLSFFENKEVVAVKDSLFARGTISTAPFASRLCTSSQRVIVLNRSLNDTSEMRRPVSELERVT